METAKRVSYISVTLAFMIVFFALDIEALPTLQTTTNKTIAASSFQITNRTTLFQQKSKIQLSSTTDSKRMTNSVTPASTSTPTPVLKTTMKTPQTPTVKINTCGQAEIDIVIILDSSNSVGNDNYQKMKNFCKDFLKNADLDSGNIRVGILSYSTFVHVEFHMNEYNTSQDIMEAIDAIPYRFGATNTADGLKIMRTEMFTAPNGDRNGVTDKVLVLTDGVSNINPLKTIPEAEQARAEGIHIYAIGIGLKDNQELDAMASVPASENSFSLHDFDELAVLSDSLFNAFCPDIEDMKDLDMLNQFEFWIYILMGFGSCLVLVFIIWLCWFCLRSKNTKVSNGKHNH